MPARSEWLLPVVTALIVAGAAVSPASAQSQVVDILLTPAATQTASGGYVHLSVQVEPNGQEVSGVDVCVTFPASLLQAVDADTGASGVQVQADTGAFNIVLANTVDNSTGVIKYSAGKLMGGLPTASFTLATITLQAASVNDAATVAFSTSTLVCGATPTAAVLGGDGVLRRTFSSLVTIGVGALSMASPTAALPPASSTAPTVGPTPPLPTATDVPTPAPSPVPSWPISTVTPIATHTATPTATPSLVAAPTAITTPLAMPTPAPVATPMFTPAPIATHVATPTITSSLIATPTAIATPRAIQVPAPATIPMPTATPLAEPTTMPADTPARAPVPTAPLTMAAVPAQAVPASTTPSAPRTPILVTATATAESRSPSTGGAKSPGACTRQVGSGSVEAGLFLLLVSPILLGSRFQLRS